MFTSRWMLRFGIPIAGLIFTVIAALPTFGWKWQPLYVPENSRFFCQQQTYSEDGQVWTIFHNNGNDNPLPWMRMVNEFGGEWNGAKRCDAIADRLELFRKDGLIELNYRSDPNTPKQFVICAKTKKSGGNCPLLVTLKPNEDPYSAFSKSVAALHNRKYVDLSTEIIPQTGAKRIASVNVEHLLGEK
jgi:hypothetical protein